jgi:hypothetical protein
LSDPFEETEFKERPKKDAAKMALAARLRRETTLTISEIAQRLHMGSRKSLSGKLHQWRKPNEKHTEQRVAAKHLHHPAPLKIISTEGHEYNEAGKDQTWREKIHGGKLFFVSFVCLCKSPWCIE